MLFWQTFFLKIARVYLLHNWWAKGSLNDLEVNNIGNILRLSRRSSLAKFYYPSSSEL